MQNEIKEKINIFIKIALILSILSIFVQGGLKLCFGVDWFDLEVNQKLSDFFLFKNVTIQIILDKLLLFFNYLIMIAIAIRHSMKKVFNKTWILITIAVLLDFVLSPQLMFIPALFGGIILIYYFCRIKNKKSKLYKVILDFIIASLLLVVYQAATLFIRFNGLPQLGMTFTFYEELVYVIDMYILCYFIYKLRLNRRYTLCHGSG
jgi:hypothetical protein